MNTDSRRKASAAYHAKREAEGLKKVTLWLSPEARFKLDALKAAAGSKDKAAELAILAWRGIEPSKPKEPPVAQKWGSAAPKKAGATKAAVVIGAAEIYRAEHPEEAAGRTASVPLHKPKAFNPQPKKGTKR